MTEGTTGPSHRPSRRTVVKTLTAGAAAAAATAVSGGPARAAGSPPLDVRTLSPFDLSFSAAATSVPYAVVPPRFRTLEEEFTRDSLHRYEQLHPDGSPARLNAGRGALKSTGAKPYFTLLRSATAQRAPYSAVVVDVRAMAGGTKTHDTVLVGLARDADRYLMGWYNNATGTVGVDVSVDGEVTTLGSTPAKLAAPFRLALSVTGPGAAVLADEGDGWRHLTDAVVSDHLDLRGIGGSAGNAEFDVATDVPKNGTLGQLFTAKAPFVSVGGMFPTHQTRGTEVTLSLHRDGPGGELITRSRLTDIPDNNWQYLTVEQPLPAGTYYLEQSEAVGPVAWWTSSTDRIDWGTAYQDGGPVTGDRTIRLLSAPAEAASDLLAAYRNAFGVRADAGTIVVDRVEAGYWGQAGIRDPNIVTWPDGRPYIEDGALYLTLSNHGLAGGIPAAHLGVFRLPLRANGRLEETGKIFLNRSGQVHGDHAGHVVYDPELKGFRVFAVTFGDYDLYNRAVTEYATTSHDVLHGVSLLAPREVARGIDPFPLHHEGAWWLALSDSGTTTTYRFADDAFAEPERVGANDNGGVYYEGTKLSRIGREWYVLTSSSTDYRVYDLRAELLGTLRAPHPDGWIPHAMVLPLALPGDRTRYLQLSMDGDGDPVSGAFGHFRVNLSDQTVRGREFPGR
ncbi:hypothetical protein [Streptomyces sp. NBC_00304]|uniref:hypothetical protein n=1 Tax=Streptomyces sp. NBC_00304 TaxID=2975706 RepID=UPI002E29EB27|nr:hypothetical protein [Streptomyces sp. NBC_00304]